MRPAALHQLESRRSVTGDEQQRQVPAQPASGQERARPDREQRGRVGLAALPRQRDRFAGRLLVGKLMLLPQGKEQLALAAKMVIQAADA